MPTTALRRAGLYLTVAYVFVGCEPTAPRDPALAFNFEGDRIGAPTVFAIRNTGSQVLFLSRCGDRLLPEIERRTASEWTNVAAAVCPANVRMDPIRLEVGAVLLDSVTVTTVGLYRLRVAVLVGSPSAQPEVVSSPSFAIAPPTPSA